MRARGRGAWGGGAGKPGRNRVVALLPGSGGESGSLRQEYGGGRGGGTAGSEGGAGGPEGGAAEGEEVQWLPHCQSEKKLCLERSHWEVWPGRGPLIVPVILDPLLFCLSSAVARIQFRLPDGSSFTNQFPSETRLREAREFAAQASPYPCPVVSLAKAFWGWGLSG